MIITLYCHDLALMMYLSTASLMSWYEYDMNLRKKSSFVKIVQENVFFFFTKASSLYKNFCDYVNISVPALTSLMARACPVSSTPKNMRSSRSTSRRLLTFPTVWPRD